MQIRQNLIATEKMDLKCPHDMTPEFIVVHNTGNNASANNEISYMISNSKSTLFHIAVDDIEAVQGKILTIVPKGQSMTILEFLKYEASDGYY